MNSDNIIDNGIIKTHTIEDMYINQILIVKLDKFLYLREPDYIISIEIDQNEVYDYYSKKKINLQNTIIGILLDYKFIPTDTLMIFKKKNNDLLDTKEIYESKKIKKKIYNGKLISLPKNKYFTLKIIDNIIYPKYLVAKLKKININDDKNYIDLTINNFYKIRL